MNKKNLVIVFLVAILGLSMAIYQYSQEMKAELAAAYQASKPASGHSWSEMQCTSDLCIANSKVGIGTDNPSEKLEVNGTIKATDVCNTAGNCLSALATLTNACGSAAKSYASNATAFSGTYCAIGTSTPAPASLSFPTAGNPTTWTCPVANDPDNPISCTATLSVDGVCGAASGTYACSATGYNGAYCSSGTASSTPGFPSSCGSSSSWSCQGSGGGGSASCTATRNAALPLVNGVHTELSCTAAGGTVVASDVSYNQCRFSAATCPSGWTRYQSYGTNGGNGCCGGGSCGNTCCTTPTQTWGNPSPASSICTYNAGGYLDGGCQMGGPYSCYPTLSQIGCY